tara:strand:- start:96213 stop:96692 length:480 start_codon:yes stop_codon:yes gene_type:complete
MVLDTKTAAPWGGRFALRRGGRVDRLKRARQERKVMRNQRRVVVMRGFGVVPVSLIAAVSLAVLTQAASAQPGSGRQLEADIQAATNQSAEDQVRVMDPNQQAWVLVPRSVAQTKGGTSYPDNALPEGYPTGSTFMSMIDAFAESDAGEKVPNTGVQSF